MRTSLRISAVLALLATVAAVPVAPAAADPVNPGPPVLVVAPSYLCWESQPTGGGTTAGGMAALASQGCDLQFTLSTPAPRPILLTYRTEALTARPVQDYEEVRAGSLTIQPGATRGAIPLRIVVDDVPEPEEVFLVRPLQVVNATVSVALTVVRVVDVGPPLPR